MNKQSNRLAINMIANVVSFIVNMGISFLLSPYIINNVGKEAYGFVSLANNFISYAQVATVALNSMASRFITIKIYEKNEKETNKYFSSVLIANIFMALVLIFPSTFIVLFLNSIIRINKSILFDVQILWSLLFASFLISLITNVFGIATFSTNRLDLSAKRNIESNIIKVIVLVCLFYFFKPSVWYIGMAGLISSIYVVITNIYYTKKLLPNVNFNKKLFEFHIIKEIVSSGIWNSFTSLSVMLLAGLDLIIANLFVGSTAMGTLSIAKTVPTAIGSLLGTIQSVFVPQFMISYAKNDRKKLLKDINSSIKFMTIISGIPIIGFLVFGQEFYSLWVPKENSSIIQILSALTMGTLIITAPIKPLYSIYTVTNKVKMESITIFIQGVLSTIIVFLLLNILPKEVITSTSIPVGLFIIAGTSTILGCIRALTFTPIYAAMCLKIKWYSFYKAIIKSLFNMGILFLLFNIVKFLSKPYSWGLLILDAGICCIIALIFGIFILLNKEERKIIFGKLHKKIN